MEPEESCRRRVRGDFETRSQYETYIVEQAWYFNEVADCVSLKNKNK